MPLSRNSIIFTGDSITEGFPFYVFFKGISIYNFGISGEKSSDIVDIIGKITEKKPRKLFLMYGINDLYTGVSEVQLFKNTKLIISKIKEISPSTQIYLQSTLPVGGAYAFLNNDIIKYNNELEIYSKENQLTYINLHKKFFLNGSVSPRLTYDGLHLNIFGYRLWKREINSYIND